jgi:hypothetical protein
MKSDVNHVDRKIHVVLSERNIKTLLTKLSMEGSARTIFKLPQEDTAGYLLIVSSQKDEEHYGDVTPGVMHPQTEKDIKAIDGNK